MTKADLSTGPAASAVLEVEDLRIVFSAGGAFLRRLGWQPGVRAVDGVSFHVAVGEVLGIVGESGSGKTTAALGALRLTPITDGHVRLKGADVTRMAGRDLRRIRRDAAMIFQDPHSSLSPRRRVSSLLTEPYSIHRIPPGDRYSVPELLEMVELPTRLADLYPHELSGGQARRVGIARALALRPALIVADEPTAGLDVSAASAILNLLQSLRTTYGTAFVVITHALNFVGYLADRIAVMYLGRIVESGPAELVYDHPLHPYTKALIASVPGTKQQVTGSRPLVSGEVPSPRNPPSGCRFHTRCPFVVDRCRTVEPTFEEVGTARWVACHEWRTVARESGAAEAIA